MTELTALFIPDAVWGILGLDDPCRYADVERIAVPKGYRCIGSRDALLTLVTEINDRATEGEDGFNESPRSKAACRKAISALRRDGWQPRT